jgi:HAE1 family hydrophobic/amphiphilic exporter-1
MGRIKNVEDFNRIVISYRADGSVITFADVGRVQDSTQEVRSATRLSGTPAIGVQVRKQSGTNTVEVVDRVQEKLQRIQAQLPQDITISIGNDQSRFIRRSFEDIKLHLILGGLLASVVVVPVHPQPARDLHRCAGDSDLDHRHLHVHEDRRLHAQQHDDAGAVAGHRHRHRRCDRGAGEHLPVRRGERRQPKEAAAEATKEIGMAVMATTLSLVVIFVPVAFMTGQIGRYFYSFGLTSAAAILLSMFVSFTLTPALCAMWLKPEDAKSDHSNTKSSGFYAKLDAAYGKMLVWSLHHRAVMMGIAGVVGPLGRVPVSVRRQGAGARRRPGRVQHQRAPAARHQLSAHRGVHQADRERGPGLPALQRVMQNVNSGFASFNIMMVPLEERKISQQELMIQARQMLRKYQGARISVSGGTDISGASSGGGGGPRWPRRRRWRLQPPEHPHPGAGHRAAAGRTRCS